MNPQSQSIDTHVGNKLKNLRAEFSLSQQQLGKVIGVSYQMVQKYESGSCRLGPNAMMRISQSLNIPVSYFFNGFYTPAEQTVPTDTEAELAQMVSLFSKIKNPVFRRALLEKAQNYLRDELAGE
ncbi:MAG: helix-turn-helix transcriptional regulator [Blastochloris viridis]|uniref:Helix-turn-helix transcriptional regulator n=1 Tax=Blastochloris viridis TaxID=1079 RepID=A0A6N4R740_BLAVI|nr:MAG: helix-turn-helix transcriptional regulator [Blastochloris viridis]